ncbi:MAG: 2-isopropylmalate synthase [bacterium]|nr:2-isopropylmalate synthase [bacterium]
MDRIYIFDTTLRDGEQSPGASMDIKEKLEIATQLGRLGVDIIEAGFPMSSPGDFEAVRLIAQTIEGPTICGLSRARKGDIDRTWEAISSAKKPRIHTFISASDVQIEHQLHKTHKEVLEIAREMVTLAKGYTEDVEFSPMDATRAQIGYLYEMIETVIDAGATTINIPDTVGYAIPEEFGNLIGSIKKNVRGIDKVIISVHCHNDLGLSTANSLAAIKNGCRQVECTINGIGERAGNAALEEIVMAINTRKDLFNFVTGIDTTQIYKTSRLVSQTTRMIVQSNKAIVGANAFAHESGIHQDGFLKERTTYEIMTPQSIGLTSSKIVLGKLSGRHAFKNRLEELGYELSEEEIERAFEIFKKTADKKKQEITSSEIEAIIGDEIKIAEEYYHLDSVEILCGDKVIPLANIRLVTAKGEILESQSSGSGPVEAIYKSIDKVVNIPTKLVDYTVHGVTGGSDAMGEVSIRIESGGKTFSGRGADTDIIVASAKAYLNAINRLMHTA